MERKGMLQNDIFDEVIPCNGEECDRGFREWGAVSCMHQHRQSTE